MVFALSFLEAPAVAVVPPPPLLACLVDEGWLEEELPTFLLDFWDW